MKGIYFVIRKFRIYLIMVFLLSAAILLLGCEETIDMDNPPPETETSAVEDPPPPDAPIRNPSVPGQFTIRYVPDEPINPITSLSRDNIVLSSLLYESLFRLDGSLIVEPLLCESWSTEDGITYEFTLKPFIAMSDGSFLTADDVVYTFEQAMQRGRFINRLSVIRSVESDEELTVTIVLRSANYRFINLLDVPIIKNGSIDARIPPGTGSYVFANTGALRLVRFIRHRDQAKLPIPEIALLECEDNELAELFDSGTLSLLWDDPADAFDIILNRQNELRLYDTTAMQFIGFNARSIVLSDADVRRAIGSSINRQHITGSIMPGQSHPTRLALSPAYRLYEAHWEQTSVDPLREMSALLRRAGLEDADNDSFLEYPDGFGGFLKIALDFIVNSENTYKVQAAHRIADTLRLYGVSVVVRELPWENFLISLEVGAYDMYYGEVVLGADFDFSPLLTPDGYLNYGLTGHEIYRPVVEAFLSAQTDDEERMAALNLCNEINLNAPFVPILYKRYAVYTPIGAISSATPSQSGVFSNFADWTIDLTMIP